MGILSVEITFCILQRYTFLNIFDALTLQIQKYFMKNHFFYVFLYFFSIMW